MSRSCKSMMFFFILLLMGLSLFGCSSLIDNKKVFSGKSKHWKARFEITKEFDADGTNGVFQLEYIGDKLPISNVEYTFRVGTRELTGFFERIDSRKLGRGRSNYDFEEVQNNILTVEIRWEGFEERMQLKPADN